VEPVDLNALVAGMKELLESTLGRGIKVEVVQDPAAWPAMADPSQLELVLLNLAINARDAMPGGGRLTIRTGNACMPAPFRPEDPPEGEHAVLVVGDTGHGMPPSILARVFEPFFTTKDVGRGSGLGLPQVLGVAQQMGGGIAITSVPDQGTEVRVFLPRASDAPAEAPRVPAVEAPPGLLRGARLLLVDDDTDVREIARVMLEELGAVVVEAESGSAALLHLQTGRFDLVLADYTMPQMTGMELAREIAQIMPGLPVLLMTGYGSVAVSDPGPHIRGTLLKPFRTEALSQVLLRELGLGETGAGQAGTDSPVAAGE
jgi:CheY-like chemotaxis protein